MYFEASNKQRVKEDLLHTQFCFSVWFIELTVQESQQHWNMGHWLNKLFIGHHVTVVWIAHKSTNELSFYRCELIFNAKIQPAQSEG